MTEVKSRSAIGNIVAAVSDRDMSSALEKTYDLLLEGEGGLYRDAMIDTQRFKVVLALRQKHGKAKKDFSNPTQGVSRRAPVTRHGV
jgi:hypothetical protein